MGPSSRQEDRLRHSGLSVREEADACEAPPCGAGEIALRAARSECTVLITGDTGVGKGFLAKWMHRSSQRARGPFIPVNCGAIPDTLVDSQLFGHAKGAFSGASSDHLGLVRAAEKGTLFLDEVGELPTSAQLRLLRLLQDREVQPVGHPRPITVNIRVMAATNGDLRNAVEQRAFREDLLFRLDVIRIHVKSLRERRGDLPILLDQFNCDFADLYRQKPLEFTPDAREVIMAYDWPGNIRQLRTIVERLYVLSPDERVTADRLREIGRIGRSADHELEPRSIEDVRYEEVIRVLERSGGSVSQAAATFGVHRSTIYRWLRNGDESSTESNAGRS